MVNVYISASTQKDNIGVLNYGTEQDRMMFLADRVKFYLQSQNLFNVFRNQPNWTLQQTIDDCNAKMCCLFVDNHTNADQPNSEGTETFYHGNSISGKKLAQSIYDKIAPLSLGVDRGVKSDFTLYNSGLAVLRGTNPPACLVEHIFHTSTKETTHYLANVDLFAKAEAMAICAYLGFIWTEPTPPKSTVDLLVEQMVKDGLVSDVKYWTDVLNGNIPAKPEYLQIAFKRAVDKI